MTQLCCLLQCKYFLQKATISRQPTMADGKPQLIAAVTEVSSLFVFPRGCAKEIQTRVKEVDSHPQSKYIINRQPIRDPLPPLIYPIIWFSSVHALFNVSDQGVDQTSTFSHRLPVALLRAAQIPVCHKKKGTRCHVREETSSATT